jgi:competence ComEA-like helix-hairpin-helix protein
MSEPTSHERSQAGPPPPVWATTLPTTPADHDNKPPRPLVPSQLQPFLALLVATGVLVMTLWLTSLAMFAGGIVTSDSQTAASSAGNTTGYRVDPNTARREELLQLPRVGPALADRIITRRESTGPYRSIDDLLEIPGIGDVTLAAIRPFLRIAPAPSSPAPPAGPTDNGL